MGRAIKDLTVTASPPMDSATILVLAALSGLVPGAALPQARSLRPAPREQCHL